MKRAATFIALAGLATAASANDYFGGGGSFPDGGGPGNQFSSSIVIADSGSILDLNLTLQGASHTFVGDLIITLRHVNTGTSVVVVDRPGVPDFSGFGWAYNLSGDYTFDDSASTTWQDVNGGVQDDFLNIASGSYLGENALAAFNGQDISGTWTLTISDNAGFDVGAIQGWAINATIPTPSSVALLGLAGLVGTRRRR